MKSFVIPVLAIFFLAFAGRGYCQDSSGVKNSGEVWRITISAETGYTTFALSDAHLLFGQALETYRQIYIPVPPPTSFPGNMLIGGSVLFTSDIPVRIGFGGYYSKTASASSYRDFSGTLVDRMDVDMITLHLILEVSPDHDLSGLYIYAHPGVSYARIAFSEEVNMTYPVPQSASNNSAGYGFAIEGDFGLGFRTTINRFPVTIEFGYREGITGNLTDTEGMIQVPLDISGLMVGAKIGMNL